MAELTPRLSVYELTQGARDLLLRGYLTSLSGNTRPWPEDGFVMNDHLMEDVIEFCRQQRIPNGKWPNRESLGKFLKGKLKL